MDAERQNDRVYPIGASVLDADSNPSATFRRSAPLRDISPATARRCIQYARDRYLHDHGASSSSIVSGSLAPTNTPRLTMGVAGPQAIPEAPAPQSQSASTRQQAAGVAAAQATHVMPAHRILAASRPTDANRIQLGHPFNPTSLTPSPFMPSSAAMGAAHRTWAPTLAASGRTGDPRYLGAITHVTEANPSHWLRMSPVVGDTDVGGARMGQLQANGASIPGFGMTSPEHLESTPTLGNGLAEVTFVGLTRHEIIARIKGLGRQGFPYLVLSVDEVEAMLQGIPEGGQLQTKAASMCTVVNDPQVQPTGSQGFMAESGRPFIQQCGAVERSQEGAATRAAPYPDTTSNDHQRYATYLRCGVREGQPEVGANTRPVNSPMSITARPAPHQSRQVTIGVRGDENGRDGQLVNATVGREISSGEPMVGPGVKYQACRTLSRLRAAALPVSRPSDSESGGDQVPGYGHDQYQRAGGQPKGVTPGSSQSHGTPLMVPETSGGP